MNKVNTSYAPVVELDTTPDYGSGGWGFESSRAHNPLVERTVYSASMDELTRSHEYWMAYAFREAEKAYAEKEVPVGAVIVFDNKIIGKGYNQIERLQDPTAHAELIAITAACDYLGSRRLLDTTLYVTLEPCSMCAGAIVLARIPTLVFGASDPKTGSCGSLYNIVQDERLNHSVELVSGVMENRCSIIVSDFFRRLRETN